MNKRIEYVCATRAHAEFVGRRMRVADQQEVVAATGLDPRVAIQVSLRASSIAVAALVEGEPAGIFGVVPVNMIDNVGSPWMLGTDTAAGVAREWLVEAPQWLRLIGDGYALLRNHVDARNTRSKAWLRRMGFTLFPPEPFGVRGLAFHRFERTV